MIKQMYFLMFLLISVSSSGCYTERRNNCFPDKGIKKAKISAKVKSEASSSKKELFELIEVIDYDKKGRPTLNTSPNGEKKIRSVYKNDKQKYIITTQLDLPAFHTREEGDLSIAHSNYRTDTAHVLEHYTDGRPMQIRGADGVTVFFEYNGCNTEIQTFLKEHGDTIQQFELKNNDGVLVERKWIGINPTVSSRITRYYDYEFNKHGHWIKRNYKHQGGRVIIEKRELTYY